MVYRIFAEKKPGLDNEARALCADINSLLGITSLEKIRIINRYDVENIEPELFDYAVKTVFSEPQLDDTYTTFSAPDAAVFAVEYLPGQFDLRADSAAQCIQIISTKERPDVKTAKVYALYGRLTGEEIDKIKSYVINPVEARLASSELPDTLSIKYDVPEDVEILDGFLSLDKDGLSALIKKLGLAMDEGDIAFTQEYFKKENRCPTITEIRMIDTYWSDHCRHTTFLTTVDSVHFEDELLKSAWERYTVTRKSLGRTKPVNLMDVATIAVKSLKKQGLLDKLDESEEINACTVKIKVDTDSGEQDWLLLFKNETHNHPTEIEPFGGAATCIGGAIRDPLSGRAYVYAAMRVTGAADPLVPINETIPGKLPQRKIVTTAAAGYSSYGNQIGLATGQVDELYHPGYAAKRMEIGAVIGAAPAKNVRRERPLPGDLVILLGGRTGRDGCGGATGSSKSHTVESLSACGAEVQKGNAPEERKLQRLFRNPEASLLIKRCNDFGAGGVSVAIGELADGLIINLDLVPKKYEGLDGTALAISESQERMAVVISPDDRERFLALAESENLEATAVAEVRDEPRLVMTWRGKTIVDISRDFLDSNGAEKHIDITLEKCGDFEKSVSGDFCGNYRSTASDLNVCSKRGLSERFDSTIGAGSVLMPFGGKYQLTPSQAMVNLVSSEKENTDTCSFMAWGFNPSVSSASPYHGAYLAVIESITKLIATGAKFEDVYLTFQEYFEKPGRDPARWGKPLSALLGALSAQLDFGVGAIGGKDSMSGSFEKLDVPPTLVSFAVTTGKAGEVISPEFKKAGSPVIILSPEYGENALPRPESLKAIFNETTELMRKGYVLSAFTPLYGGIAAEVMKACFGNGIGFEFDKDISNSTLFGYSYGSIVLELDREIPGKTLIGRTTAEKAIKKGDEKIDLSELLDIYEGKLESVYSCNIKTPGESIPSFSYQTAERKAPAVKCAVPKVVIPVFPGTNCEYDSARAVRDGGGCPEIIVINNLSPARISSSVEKFAESVRKSQMIFIPGGFSGGDEPDGSGKFITAFFRNAEIKDAVTELLDKRDGLMCGICNGFQALIKLGLVPFGKIIDTDECCPTLTFNTISRHQSRLVHTRVSSNKSPWLSKTRVGEIYTVPVSHGEGRFICSDELIKTLSDNGQIATQYADLDARPTDDIHFNPNGSVCAIEGITSPDGRVFGKMGHTERTGKHLYRNVPGVYEMNIFSSAVEYFR